MQLVKNTPKTWKMAEPIGGFWSSTPLGPTFPLDSVCSMDCVSGLRGKGIPHQSQAHLNKNLAKPDTIELTTDRKGISSQHLFAHFH